MGAGQLPWDSSFPMRKGEITERENQTPKRKLEGPSGSDDNSLMERMLFAFYSNSTAVSLQKSSDIKNSQVTERKSYILRMGML